MSVAVLSHRERAALNARVLDGLLTGVLNRIEAASLDPDNATDRPARSRPMTRTLEDTADERARLANMALADCGLPETTWSKDTDGIRHVVVDNHVTAFRAVWLATMHLHGPQALVSCWPCTTAHQFQSCERIPVADALRGMTCGKHGGTT